MSVLLGNFTKQHSSSSICGKICRKEQKTQTPMPNLLAKCHTTKSEIAHRMLWARNRKVQYSTRQLRAMRNFDKWPSRTSHKLSNTPFQCPSSITSPSRNGALLEMLLPVSLPESSQQRVSNSWIGSYPSARTAELDGPLRVCVSAAFCLYVLI